MLEPDEGKLASPVLRGPGRSNPARLPGPTEMTVNPAKRLIIICLATGAGFALMMGILFGIWKWYQSRPIPWNENSIKGAFNQVLLPPGSEKAWLDFILQNNSDRDYYLTPQSLILMTKLKNEQALSMTDFKETEDLNKWRIFVPAEQRVTISVDWGIVIGDPPYTKAPAHDQAVKSILESNVEKFVIFDKTNHLQIELPLRQETPAR